MFEKLTKIREGEKKRRREEKESFRFGRGQSFTSFLKLGT